MAWVLAPVGLPAINVVVVWVDAPVGQFGSIAIRDLRSVGEI